ncbi:Carboxypeptidase B [Folsomia candida]|uniref:Carboxypeptidase B n=1 Tax=Folsomia candida TaxID=158441 RepID=A0A226F3N9_FOLCA|nr:Carboxypeptidase B [Folsomia candida]
MHISTFATKLINRESLTGRNGLALFINSSRVYRIVTNSSAVLSSLAELYDSGILDIWGMPSRTGTDILISSQEEESILMSILSSTDRGKSDLMINSSSPNSGDNFLLKVIIPNVKKLLDQQDQHQYNHPPSRVKSSGGFLTWNEYHPLETITEWMENLAKFYPETTTLIKIGESWEGLPMHLMKISAPPSEKEHNSTQKSFQKRGVFIDATIHAREWVTTSVATWVIKELVTDSPSGQGLLDRYDFYIAPILNPDGYRHSWKLNRLWRKSRRSISNWLIACRGVDLNRNFGHEWGGQGASRSSCSSSYRGNAAFSEPETRAVKEWVEKMKGEVDWAAYFTLHSYGQKWMTPWGYTNTVLPRDYREMIRVARIGTRALRAVHGTEYEVGSSSDMLYLAAGGSDDWWTGVVGVTYSYTLELRDTGLWGFLLPSSQIQDTVEETWAGIAASLKAIPTRLV